MQRNDDGEAARDRGDKEKGDESPIRRLSLSGASERLYSPASHRAKSSNENTT